MDDGLLKVLTMLLGEFDFIDTILEDPDSTWVTKLLFSGFLIGMSIVLMNLVVGLAISDISALRLAVEEELTVAPRHEAHIRKTISLMMAIEATEQLAEVLVKVCRWLAPHLRTRVTSQVPVQLIGQSDPQASCLFEEKIFVELKSVSDWRCGGVEVVVQAPGGVREVHRCPRSLATKVRRRLQREQCREKIEGSASKMEQVMDRLEKVEELATRLGEISDRVDRMAV